MLRKTTAIIGRDAKHKIKVYHLSGHWNITSAVKYGRSHKLIGEFMITHYICDTSGKGRSGHDGRWKVLTNGTLSKQAESMEFGKEVLPKQKAEGDK